MKRANWVVTDVTGNLFLAPMAAIYKTHSPHHRFYQNQVGRLRFHRPRYDNPIASFVIFQGHPVKPDQA